MFLRILKNESLRSYVERNLFIFNRSPNSKSLKDLYYRNFNSPEVRSVAKKLGWHGCYGFNKIIHNHTGYPWYSVIRSKFDFSYSGGDYLSTSICANSLIDSRVYCPICFKEDELELGFSYWRRYHRCVKVCSKHNVVLLEKCQFCDRPLDRRGHEVDVMWRGCEGRHLGEADPVPNTDPMALRIANFFDGLCSARRHIYDVRAMAVLDARLTKKNAERDSQLSGRDLVEEFRCYQQFINKDGAYFSMRRKTSRHRVIEFAVLLYDSFDEFVHDCDTLEPNSPSIDFFWDTYRLSNSGSENFIKEDYRLGVAEWSWPHFADWKSDPSRDDDVHASRSPRHYRCCNPADAHLVGFQPTGFWSRQRTPVVPQLTESELVAMTKWSTSVECLPVVPPATKA